MARTSYASKAMPGGSTGIDTEGYGQVTIVGTTTAASSAITITVSNDGSNYAAFTAGDVIDPISGKAPTLTGLASGKTVIVSYIGPARYVKAVGTTTNVIVVLGEPRDGTSTTVPTYTS